MRIEHYFVSFRDIIDACLWVRTSSVTYDQRTSHQGFVRGDIEFLDGSVLHVREFIDTETGVERLTYAYQYMDVSHRMSFRYDNSGHHWRLNLSSFPHHKHVESKSNIIAADAPDLASVLREIGQSIQLTNPDESSN